jgi:DNA (cytosine-5)-methyltransferase 1
MTPERAREGDQPAGPDVPAARAIRQPRVRARVVGIDFFCGAGGLTRGFLDAGIDVRGGVDLDNRLKRTYEANNESSRFICKDIADVDIFSLRQELGVTADDVVLYAACTPCQPFSTLNQRRRSDSPPPDQDARRSLLLTFGDIVLACPPDFVVVENVPGLSSATGREIYDAFVDKLKQAGLSNIDRGELDARFHRVPQVRKRFVMVASAHGRIRLPRRSPGGTLTVRDAIGNLGKPTIGITGAKSRSACSAAPEAQPPNHVARALGDQHLRIVEAIPADGGSRSEVQDKTLLLPCHQRNPNLHRDVFGRLAWDAPAPTLTCRCTDVYCGRFVHPTEHRGLSLREAAAIQTFPAEYTFYGTFHHAAQQIGNAVPVKLAGKLGRVVVRAAKTLERQ